MAKGEGLNTSCKATYKDGRVQVFRDMEHAAQALGITVKAVMTRCNRPGTKGKDGTTLEWTEDATARHYRARSNRNKGKRLEHEIVDELRKIGYADVCRSAGESKRLDDDGVDIADTSGTLPFAIQAKHQANFPNFFKLRKECRDKRDYVLIWKKSASGGRNGEGTVAVMDSSLFYRLLESYGK